MEKAERRRPRAGTHSSKVTQPSVSSVVRNFFSQHACAVLQVRCMKSLTQQGNDVSFRNYCMISNLFWHLLRACFFFSTTVMTAHRLSTIKSADCILVFARGRIVEVITLHQFSHLISLSLLFFILFVSMLYFVFSLLARVAIMNSLFFKMEFIRISGESE